MIKMFNKIKVDPTFLVIIKVNYDTPLIDVTFNKKNSVFKIKHEISMISFNTINEHSIGNLIIEINNLKYLNKKQNSKIVTAYSIIIHIKEYETSLKTY